VATVVAGNTIAFLIALPAALPVASARAQDWWTVGYLGVFQIGLAYLFLSAAIRHLRALEASLLLLVEPALNPVFAWLAHDERPSRWALVGGVLIIGATTLRTVVEARLGLSRRSGPPGEGGGRTGPAAS
jgi:drug/metabolite transporter, DME family